MKKKSKYAYISVIKFKYCDLPWEDVSEYWTAEEKKNVRRDLKAYRISRDGQYRLINMKVNKKIKK